MEAHQIELFRYLRFIGANYSLAQDLAQETFLRAFKATAMPDLDKIPVRRAWLRKIGRNLFYDHCRRDQRSPIHFSSSEAESADAFWESDFFHYGEGEGRMEALQQCLKKLTERQRGVIEDFYSARRSRDEIAATFDISGDGVKMILRRVRHSLGDCIKQQILER